jgi:hypothetical protein
MRLADGDLAGAPARAAAGARTAASRGRPAADAAPRLLVARGAAAVDRYLQPVPEGLVPESTRPVDALTITFAIGGNSRPFMREGWSGNERNFTWTAADRAVLQVPRPPGPAIHLLRLIAAPFTAQGQLSSQRVELVVNGETVGHDTVRDLSVLECEIPWDLIAPEKAVEIMIMLPDAVQANSFKDVKDTRTLGLAVRSLSLVRIGPLQAAPAAA